MNESDVILAFPGNPISGGVHIELGWASALHKKIYIFLEKTANYSPLITGLKTVTDVELVEITEDFSVNSMIDLVEKVIRERE